MSKEKRTTERKTIITERFIGSKTNRATWIERAEIDVHQDGELIYHESMSGEWYRYKGTHPSIKALTHLSSKNKCQSTPHTITTTIPLKAIRQRIKKRNRFFHKLQKSLWFYNPKPRTFADSHFSLFQLLLKNASVSFLQEMDAHIALCTALKFQVLVKQLPVRKPAERELLVQFYSLRKLEWQIKYRWWPRGNEAILEATFGVPLDISENV